MTGIIQILNIGINADNFLLYSDVDNYLSAFETNVSRQSLIDGFPSDNIPDGTQTIRALSTTKECPVFLDIDLGCYQFIPSDFYFLDYIFKPNQTYFYGNFTDYLNGSITESYNSLIRLNDNLTIDNSFNVGTGFTGVLYTGESIIEQPDGKLICTGSFTNYNGTATNRIIRLNNDGSIDTSFTYGTGFNNFTLGSGIDSNGSIIITGFFDQYDGNSCPRIARLLSDGTFDNTFVIGSGFNNTSINVLVNSDDSMFITGYFTSYNGTGVPAGITKLTSTGAIDTSFNGGSGFFPTVNNQPKRVARIQNETSFYVTGYFTEYNGTTVNYIVKLNEDGSIDTSANFGTGLNGIGYDLQVVWGDKILVRGIFEEYNGTPSYNGVILNADGSIFYAFPEIDFSPYTYYYPLIIGNKLFNPVDGCYAEVLDITNCDIEDGQIVCPQPFLLLQTGDPIQQQNTNFIKIQ